MSTLGQNFTKAEHDAGWPESLKHGQLAALQYPYVKGEPAKIRLARDRAGDILSACKSGELASTATTVTVKPKPPKLPRRNQFASDAWLMKDGFITVMKTTSSTQPHDVTTYTVTAPAFAAWLAAQPETPSEHIAAWFEAVGGNTRPEAAPMPTATPLLEQPTIWTDKRKREARAMIEKLKGNGVRAFHKMTAEHYQVSPQRLRDVLNDSGAPAPKKARGQNSVFDVPKSKVHRIK